MSRAHRSMLLCANTRLIVLVLWLTVARSAVADEPQYHDVHMLSPVSHFRQTPEKADTNPTRYEFSSMGRDFSLSLQPSPVLSRTRIYRYGSNDAELPDSAALIGSAEWLAGKVDGDPDSWVRMMFDGEVLTGYLYAFGELLALERAAGLAPAATTRTVLYDARFKPTATLPERDVDRLLILPALTAVAAQPVEPVINDGTRVTRALRIGIAVDTLFDEYHDGRGLARALSIINTVDGIYQDQLGVAVVLDSVMVFDNPETDPIRTLSNDLKAVLDQFRLARLADSTLPADLTLVHLFTGKLDEQEAIGLGWIGSACRNDGYDLGASTPFTYDGLLAAHEIAHNLGAKHDDDESCTEEYRKIMSPRLSGSTSRSFSACSREAMAPLIAASCNLDNIDLAIALSVSQPTDALEREVLVEVTNLDAERSAVNVTSVTRFPSDVTVTAINGNCVVASATLTCAHGSVGPGETSKTRLSVRFPDFSPRTLSSEILPVDHADITIQNNRVFLNLLQAPLNPGTSTSEQPPQDDALQSGGSGAVSGWWLVLLLLARVARGAGFSQLRRVTE